MYESSISAKSGFNAATVPMVVATVASALGGSPEMIGGATGVVTFLVGAISNFVKYKRTEFLADLDVFVTTRGFAVSEKVLRRLRRLTRLGSPSQIIEAERLLEILVNAASNQSSTKNGDSESVASAVPGIETSAVASPEGSI